MNKYKYPRTFHIPDSLGATNDDKTHSDYSIFEGKNIVITEKLDGESFSFYSDGSSHARSIDSRNHESRNMAKRVAGFRGHRLPQNWRACCENLYAKHSIYYSDLKGYLYLLSVWNQNNVCQDWETTLMFAGEEYLGLPVPNILYTGPFCMEEIGKSIQYVKENPDKVEGFVVRNAGSFHYDEFSLNTGKYVRGNHVQTDDHWMFQKIIPNAVSFV